jgi:rhamnose transport system ATP-binding protein
VTPATIELAGVGKAFPGVVALHGVDLGLAPGQVHALVGENGAGKSTLIHILGGSLRPDHGNLRLDGQPIRFRDAHAARRLGIVTVHQEVELFPDLSVAENIALEQGLPGRRLGWISRRDQHRRARQALDLMHAAIPPETLAAALSPAQRQLVLLGAALTQPARVLILDEPTSSLSAGEVEILFEQVRQARKHGLAILYVSHRFEEIFALADVVTVLRDGRCVWHGNLADTTPHRLIEHMVGRDIPAIHRPPPASLGPVRLRCSQLTATDGSFRDVDLEVRGGEVLGLYGLICAGRSEWAQGLLGLRPLASGEIWINGMPVRPSGPGPMAQRGLAYVPEDRLRQGLCRELSVRSNHMLASLRKFAHGLWLGRRAEARRTRAAVAALSIRLNSIEQEIGTLSGGNQQKVVVSRWLEREPTVLILDEPTRGIDVAAKDEMHALIRRLAGEGRAIVLISSDLPEVLGQSDRVGVFRGGRLTEVFEARTATAAQVAGAAMPEAPTPLSPVLGGEGSGA